MGTRKTGDKEENAKGHEDSDDNYKKERVKKKINAEE